MNEANRKDTSAWAMRRYSHHPDSGIIVLMLNPKFNELNESERIKRKQLLLSSCRGRWTLCESSIVAANVCRCEHADYSLRVGFDTK